MDEPLNNSLVNRIRVLLARGQAVDAYRLLEGQVRAQNGQSALLLAQWRLSGEIIRRDLGLARDWFGVAAKLGVEDALPVYIALLANGAGGTERRWSEAMARLAELGKRDVMAARQQDVLSAMHLTENGDPFDTATAQQVSRSPSIQTIEGFLSEKECRYLVERAQPLLKPASVVDPRSGRLIADPIRSSTSVAFPFVTEDPVLHAINRRIAIATNTQYEQGEPLQILCYRPGEEYKLHSDTLPTGHNQRVDTFLVTLSTDFEGGATSFPRAQFRWRGTMGEALHFRNVDGDGAPDKNAWHAGEPVTRGTKYILSKWIRQAPLDLSGPPGRPL